VTWHQGRFAAPALAGWAWPLAVIDSGLQGPRLCVMAGMHVNEVAAMEAAWRLAARFGTTLRRGRVEILPVVNLPALWQRTVQLCPVDGLNLNFAFPGDAAGSFTPALAASLLDDWAGDADLLIDLHGGDLPTRIAHFVMGQMTGDTAFDDRTRLFLGCFDAEIRVEFAAGQTGNTGRACNARPARSGHAVMVEGGGNGQLDEDDIGFHVDGVLNCARMLGLIDGPATPGRHRARRVSGFHRLGPPENVRLSPAVRPGQWVRKGETLATTRDVFGRDRGTIAAPVDGPVVYCLSHPIVAAGEWALAVGIPIPD
jgi:predicted deacylase